MIKVIHTTEELIQERDSEKSLVGFVPTMGNLHQGHISLLKEALKNYPTVYFSIFVNPKQFGPSEDFNRYPRTFEEDLKKISLCLEDFPKSKIVVFSPSHPDEVFPQGNNQTISVANLSTDLEGKIRPGHFDGVATVVWRLFDLVKPDTAYFGLKDYQQYLVIKQMVKDLAMPIKIEGMPIIREESGLALSSRNQYLSSEEKEVSLVLSRTLRNIRDLIQSKKNKNEIEAYILKVKEDKNWNYLELRDSENFSKDIERSKNITILAVYQLGSTRLLDNMQVEVQ